MTKTPYPSQPSRTSTPAGTTTPKPDDDDDDKSKKDKTDQSENEKRGDAKAKALAEAQKAVDQANERKKLDDKAIAEQAESQQKAAAKAQDEDEKEKAKANEAVVAIPDVDPKVPLTKDEYTKLDNAKRAIAQRSDPNQVPLTEEAQKRMDADMELPAPVVAIPSAHASATNPALMRNDTDPEKTPPFGFGARPTPSEAGRIQG